MTSARRNTQKIDWDARAARVRQDVSLVRVLEARGVALTRRGDFYAAACRFCAGSESAVEDAALEIDVKANRWACAQCGQAGDVVDWVMKADGLSLRAAVESLWADDDPNAPDLLDLVGDVRDGEAGDQELLNRIVDYYHACLKDAPEALAYLKARGLDHPDLIARFRLGYANRTLGLRLPDKSRKAGAILRARLERLGLFRSSGHEHLAGSLVAPIVDAQGRIVQLYGRKLRNDLRLGTPLHLLLSSAAHDNGPRGLWNEAGLSAGNGEAILTKGIMDSMSFWAAGYRNCTALLREPDGAIVQSHLEEHIAALRRADVRRVILGLDDPALARTFTEAGFATFCIHWWPEGLDANALALRTPPRPAALGRMLRAARFCGEGPAPAITSADAPLDAEDELAFALRGPRLEVGIDRSLFGNAPLEPSAAPDSVAPGAGDLQSVTDSEINLRFGDRLYRIRGWRRAFAPNVLRVNVLVRRELDFHVDTFDLYAAKARAAFAREAAVELAAPEEILKRDLGRVLLHVETLQDSARAPKTETPDLSAEEQAEALEYLRAPDLAARISADIEACGLVGEQSNALIAYLACTSRLLERPLALVVQSSSAAGKSSLMDAILDLMPKAMVLRYSAMTGQSLYYMGQRDLKHKILAIAEEEGAAHAAYALKLLQSEGAVTMASTGKDAQTGLLTTQDYHVEGPVALLLTTTAIDLDEELLNRCLVLAINETRAQTQAIHAAQRRRHTLAGFLGSDERHLVQKRHHAIQMMLEPLPVIIPQADQLTFLDDKTRSRRDHVKYLTLIQACALLHQHQRPIREIEREGRRIRYVEASIEDIRLANALTRAAFGRTLDDVPPQTRRLLELLHEFVAAQAQERGLTRQEVRFTRREVRASLGWGDTQLKLHLARLVELDFMRARRSSAGGPFDYALLYDGEGADGGRFVLGLNDDGLAYDGQNGVAVHKRAEAGRAAVGVQTEGGRSEKTSINPSAASENPAPPYSPQTT